MAVEVRHPLRRRICIVGAGMSGLLACKYLVSSGFDPVVLEATEVMGGIWQRTYASIALQTSRHSYCFSDFPWPEDAPNFPTGSQVNDYFARYARCFGVAERVRYGCKVVAIWRLDEKEKKHSPEGGRGEEEGLWSCSLLSGSNYGATTGNEEAPAVWEVHVEKRHSNAGVVSPVDHVVMERLYFDFVVICIGRFGDVPRMPNNIEVGEGAKVFKGRALHTIDYNSLDKEEAHELVKGKRVVVVGFQKSALDIAVEVADAVNFAGGGTDIHPCNIIYRTNYWFIPPHLKLTGVNIGNLYFSRFSELLNAKPGQGLFLSILTRLLAPVKWAVSKFVELHIQSQIPLRKYGLIPDRPFYRDVSSCVTAIVPHQFFPYLEKGGIKLYKSRHWSFIEDGLLLEDGTHIKADVVIMATGYDCEKKLLSLIPSEYRNKLNLARDKVPFYRGVIHPRIPDLAILGLQQSFSHLHTVEMGARWLVHLLCGGIKLPSVKAMEDDTQRWIKFVKEAAFPGRACLGLVHIWYSDQICKDMRWNPFRKKTWLQELFHPYGSVDYQQP